MFVDTSVLLAILSAEDDATEWAERLERAPNLMTSAPVVLEAAMRLSTKLVVDPVDVEISINDLLREANIHVIAIDADDGHLAVQAFAEFGKGRGHPSAESCGLLILCLRKEPKSAVALQRLRLFAYRPWVVHRAAARESRPRWDLAILR